VSQTRVWCVSYLSEEGNKKEDRVTLIDERFNKNLGLINDKISRASDGTASYRFILAHCIISFLLLIFYFAALVRASEYPEGTNFINNTITIAEFGKFSIFAPITYMAIFASSLLLLSFVCREVMLIKPTFMQIYEKTAIKYLEERFHNTIVISAAAVIIIITGGCIFLYWWLIYYLSFLEPISFIFGLLLVYFCAPISYIIHWLWVRYVLYVLSRGM